MSNHPHHYLPSPALSLSLAGIFRLDDGVATSSNAEMEEAGGEEGRGGGGGRDNTVHHEISSENSGGLIGRSSRSDDGFEEGHDDVEGDGDKNKRKKQRKRYHRHTAEQIREMEALFRESPHPDENQRQRLSKQLGLAPRQVKFWFQNRRTQIKAIQERHENLLLKSEMDKLREENEALRGIINKACCSNCGVATISSDSPMPPQLHQLRLENAKLKSEVEKLRTAVAKGPPGSTMSPSRSLGNEQMENRSCMEIYSGIFGLEKTKVMELVKEAMEELIKMATMEEPLWVRSVETGRQILNYDEYLKQFKVEHTSSSLERLSAYSIEASRETGVVLLDLPRLLQIFLDVNQWKEMFPSLISKAAIVDVICSGEGANRDGAVQLMFNELQMLTPMVGSREVYFMRYCKQLKEEEWAIVDVSMDQVQDTSIEASLLKCRKRPSGCIIQDTSNGHCKVTWVEHIKCEKTRVETMYRSIVKSGLGFGARRWLATLQVQCERVVFLMATNVPMKDCVGVGTMAGRKSLMKLAQRMTRSFCNAMGASSLNTWSKFSGENGEDIRVSSRKNMNERGEPVGVILCAVSCAWLPVSPNVLLHFLRDQTPLTQWHVRTGGEPVQSIVNLSKGKHGGNAVTIQALRSKEDDSNSTWILQDSSTSTYESTVVYAPVDITRMQSVITGCDSSDVPILPSGFSVVPDGMEAIRPLMMASSSKQEEEEEEKSTEGGSLLTMALQVLVSTSPSAKLTQDSVESVNSLVSCTLRNIRTSLQCEDS